jgi:hypothetical protein
MAIGLTGTAGAQTAKPTVKILFPTEGAVVPVGDVVVAMTVTGARITAADDTQNPRTGHFHLYLDKVPEHVGRPIPKGVEGIVHTAERTFAMKVTPGIHTLILVWAYGNHIPFNPWVSDTVMFEAR